VAATYRFRSIFSIAAPIMGVIFVAELLLKLLIPRNESIVPHWFEAMLDAGFLSLCTAPLQIWLFRRDRRQRYAGLVLQVLMSACVVLVGEVIIHAGVRLFTAGSSRFLSALFSAALMALWIMPAQIWMIWLNRRA
jgi:hypothetical protein